MYKSFENAQRTNSGKVAVHRKHDKWTKQYPAKLPLWLPAGDYGGDGGIFLSGEELTVS